jgi:hypothetical protein
MKKVGFTIARIRGSHHILIHEDGRRTKRLDVVYCLKFYVIVSFLARNSVNYSEIFVSDRTHDIYYYLVG